MLYILRTSVMNPKPGASKIIAQLKKLLPTIDIERAEMEADDRLELLLQAIEEDTALRAAFEAKHRGDPADAPDKVVREIIRERWGEDIAFLEVSPDQINFVHEKIKAFIVEHELRLFNELTGEDVKW